MNRCIYILREKVVINHEHTNDFDCRGPEQRDVDTAAGMVNDLLETVRESYEAFKSQPPDQPLRFPGYQGQGAQVYNPVGKDNVMLMLFGKLLLKFAQVRWLAGCSRSSDIATSRRRNSSWRSTWSTSSRTRSLCRIRRVSKLYGLL